FRNLSKWHYAALAIWILFTCAVIGSRLSAEQTPGNVFGIYREAGVA
ncbi:MAG: hypothetical protein ACI8TQ_003377, partial [Planctomycetota bacterium]